MPILDSYYSFTYSILLFIILIFRETTFLLFIYIYHLSIVLLYMVKVGIVYHFD